MNLDLGGIDKEWLADFLSKMDEGVKAGDPFWIKKAEEMQQAIDKGRNEGFVSSSKTTM